MGMSVSEIIDQGLSIPELIKLLRHAFRECEFNEVQNILMDREKRMKSEIEDLTRNRDSIKKEVCLLERTQGLAEFAKLKLEEKLQRSERKCDELKETIRRLSEEERKRSDKFSRENTEMLNEKDKLIFELNDKINELKNKNLESERLVGVYQEKLKSADQAIEDLRCEKLAANRTMEELRRKQVEADQVVEELKHQTLELTQTVVELRLQKRKSDTEAEFHKSRLEPRITKLEAELADMLDVKVDDLANLLDAMEKSATEGENVDQPDTFRGGKDSLGNGSMNADAEDVVVMSPGVHSTSNSTGRGGIGLPKKGGRNLVHSRTKVDGATMVQTSPGSQSGCSSPRVKSSSPVQDNKDEGPRVSSGRKLAHSQTTMVQTSPGSQSGRNSPRVESSGPAQDNEDEEARGSGSDASFMHLDGEVAVREKQMFGARCSSKMACSSFPIGEVIEICDSDDETNPAEKTHKRNRTDCREDSPINLATKRKRGTCISDVDSSDSEDESCSDAHMENLIATLQSKKMQLNTT